MSIIQSLDMTEGGSCFYLCGIHLCHDFTMMLVLRLHQLGAIFIIVTLQHESLVRFNEVAKQLGELSSLLSQQAVFGQCERDTPSNNQVHWPGSGYRPEHTHTHVRAPPSRNLNVHKHHTYFV